MTPARGQRRSRGPSPAPAARATPLSPELRARQRLMRTIATRELSAARARRLLLKWLPDAAFTDRLLSELIEIGAIDDRRAAEGLVRSILARRKVGRGYLLAKLAAQGIDRALAQATVDAALADRDARADARAAALSILKRISPSLDPPVRARRLVGAMARRGWSAGVAIALARELVPSATSTRDD